MFDAELKNKINNYSFVYPELGQVGGGYMQMTTD